MNCKLLATAKWSVPSTFFSLIATGVFFIAARAFHQKHNNSLNETASMLYESKKKRKEEALKAFGYDINIGDVPQKNNINRTVDLLLYLALIVMAFFTLRK